MRNIRLVCCIATFGVASVQAAANPPALTSPSPLHGFYNGRDGIFSYDSSAQILDGDPAMITSSVCNLNPKEGLIFQWNGAGFGTGLFRPLPVGSCMTQTVDGSSYNPMYDAPIIFTQHNETTRASTYVASTNNTQYVQSTLTISNPNPNNSEGNIVELIIRAVTDQFGNITYDITWSGMDDGNAIMVLTIPPDVIRHIESQIQSDGWEVRTLTGPPEYDPDGQAAEAEDYARLGVSNGDTAIEMRTFGFGGRLANCHFSYKPRDTANKPGIFALSNEQNNIVAITKLPIPNQQ